MNQTKTRGLFASILGWLLPSLFVGGLMTMALAGVLNLYFPGQSSGSLFIPQWIIFSIIVGMPPHMRPIADKELSPFGNFLVFIITHTISAVFISGLFLLLSFLLDKETFSFLLGNLGTLYLASLLYSIVLHIGDNLWQWLHSIM